METNNQQGLPAPPGAAFEWAPAEGVGAPHHRTPFRPLATLAQIAEPAVRTHLQKGPPTNYTTEKRGLSLKKNVALK